MIHQAMRRHRFIGPSLVLMLLAGCRTTMQEQLQQVAKDWSMVIRASQVVPVYPLSEDLQPGDMFLVQVPIERQHELWNDKGYLPLDQRVARLQPSKYSEFYARSFQVGGEGKELPHVWLRQQGEPPASSWSTAPLAAFPSYSFSVQEAAGVGLALPIQGVPVAMSLLGTSEVQGNVTIADAHTYGIDQKSLREDLDRWLDDGGREFLAQFASTLDRPCYLRLVSRVYVTGRLQVAVHATEAVAAGLTAGAGRPLDLLAPAMEGEPQERARQRYGEVLQSLNGSLESTAAPGGSLKLAAASARSVSMSETFPRPLVVGYLGFDMKVLEGGALGPPVDTHALLTGAGPEPAGAAFTGEQERLADLIEQVKARPEVLSAAAKQVGPLFLDLYSIPRREDETDIDRFRLLAELYRSDERGGGPRHRRLISALEKALQPQE